MTVKPGYSQGPVLRDRDDRAALAARACATDAPTVLESPGALEAGLAAEVTHYGSLDNAPGGLLDLLGEERAGAKKEQLRTVEGGTNG